MDSRFEVLVKVVANGLTHRKKRQPFGNPRPGPCRNAGFAFDDLARALAEGVPRREALRRIGGALAAAMLASLGSRFAWGQSLDCVGFCNQLPSAEASQCLQDALNGGGLCEACQADSTRLCQTATGNHVCCATSNACCNSACCQPGMSAAISGFRTAGSYLPAAVRQAFRQTGRTAAPAATPAPTG
jgi:hypothetical protein